MLTRLLLAWLASAPLAAGQRTGAAAAKAPPPKDGYRRRQLHFEAVGPQQLAGSLWQAARLQKDPAQLIDLAALDALFAQPIGGPGVGTAGAAAAAAASEGGWAGGAWFPHGLDRQTSQAVLAEGGPSMPSGGLLRQGSSAGARRPAVRFIVSGRRAVNIEILLKKLGQPTQVIGRPRGGCGGGVMGFGRLLRPSLCCRCSFSVLSCQPSRRPSHILPLSEHWSHA
jgi:hypothetical protein